MPPRASRSSRRDLFRGGLALAGLGLLTGCGIVPPPAQQPPKIPRIGFLSAGASETAEAFREGLDELGYVEGQNILIEWRSDDGLAEPLARNVAALVELHPNLIVALGTERAVAARQATGTIPIVLASGHDPVAEGLIESFARPGSNVTGHLESHPQLASRQLELLRELAPGITQVTALVVRKDDPRLQELEVAARTLGLHLRVVATPTAEVFDEALAREAGERTDALLVLHSGFMAVRQAKIFDFAARKRVPAMYGRRSYAAAGGLAAYGANARDLHHRAAEYVDRILRGAKPAELPVQLPTRFDFVINLKAAQAIGLVIPNSVLQQATEVIR
jgi:putative ABC transport system substrate-binding protein